MIVIQDTREQQPFNFLKAKEISEQQVSKLDVGDYTLKGYEKLLSIERKGCVSEIYNNLCSKDYARFTRELDKLQNFKYSYVIMCFEFSDIGRFPWSSDLPMGIKKKIGAKSGFFLKRFIETQVKYPNVHFLFAGDYAEKMITAIFKEIVLREGI